MAVWGRDGRAKPGGGRGRPKGGLGARREPGLRGPGERGDQGEHDSPGREGKKKKGKGPGETKKAEGGKWGERENRGRGGFAIDSPGGKDHSILTEGRERGKKGKKGGNTGVILYCQGRP